MLSGEVFFPNPRVIIITFKKNGYVCTPHMRTFDLFCGCECTLTTVMTDHVYAHPHPSQKRVRGAF